MPHQCTSCERVFPDGSKEMLSGCPDCGGNKFQFHPGTTRSTSSPDASANSETSGRRSGSARGKSESSTTRTGSGSDASTSDSERTDDRGHAEWPDHSGSESPPTRRGSNAPPTTGEGPSSQTDSSSQTDDSSSSDSDDAAVDTDERPPDIEDRAQASARTDVVSPDELEHAAADAVRNRRPDSEGRVIEPSSDDRPGLDELREELNSQFESIKIVSPGQYELNLMELYDRQEYIISLQEDGRYVIEMPDNWGSRDEGE